MRASSRIMASARGLVVRIIWAGWLVLAAGPVVAAAMADPIWVRFPSARAEPSALALRAFAGRAQADAHRPTAVVHGLLLAPSGPGPFPAVVLMHDCRGVRANQRSWANWFASNGYVALLVDSFYARNAINVCDQGPDRFAEQSIGGRVFDAFGALSHLSRDPRVDPGRIAVVSWGHALAISATSDSGARRLVPRGFRAGVAIGPDCPLVGDRRSAPLLIVAPGDNAWARPGNCRAFAAASSAKAPPVELLELPGAAYGFDDPQVGAGLLLAAAYNPWTSPERGVLLRYDAQAHRRGVAAAGAFLHRHMQLDGMLDPLPPGEGYPPGHWVVDPNEPGPRLPPAGASVFDALMARFAQRGKAAVPFPFEALAAELRKVAGVDEGGRSGLKVSFIPLGRSLQRAAAAPAFYRYPRVLLTIDGESQHGEAAGSFLKDRLFVAYQEKAASLEVISYNPVAGRFEFQVVQDYDARARPRVRYANRTLCVSCHHNQAPIFPRAAWDETNDNLTIARHLEQARPDLYGLREEVVASPAARFDNATDRAAELPLWNLLWREGCGGDPGQVTACRREAVKAAMHYRLTSSNSFGGERDEFHQRLVAPLRRTLRTRFDDALRMPGADIPNRDPVLQSQPTQLQARMDPLTPRPVITLAAADAASLAGRFVQGLANQIPLADVAAIDTWLARNVDAPRRTLRLSCELAQRGRFGRSSLVTLRCGEPRRPALVLELSVERQRLLRGRVRALRLADEPTQERIPVHALDALAPVASGETLVLGLSQRHSGLSVRLGNGERVEALQVLWPAQDQPTRRTPIARFFSAEVELTLVDDVAPLHRAIAGLGDPGAGGTAEAGLSASRVFSGVGTARALREKLGLASRPVCCEPGPDLKPVHDAGTSSRQRAGLAGAEVPSHSLDAAVQRFRRACGLCHSGPTVSPPGFLHGNDGEVLVKLRHCAERIYLRLSMWQLTPEERPRSPMPPASAVRGPVPVAELRELAAEWLAQHGPERPALPAMVKRGYESARRCLADDARTASR